jgi:predicted nucleotidyltransferase
MHKTALALLVQGLRELYPANLDGIYLCGSYARGEARPDSDLDVAVVFREATPHFEAMQKTAPLRRVIWEVTGLLVDFAFLTAQQWERAQSKEPPAGLAEEIHQSLRAEAQVLQ